MKGEGGEQRIGDEATGPVWMVRRCKTITAELLELVPDAQQDRMLALGESRLPPLEVGVLGLVAVAQVHKLLDVVPELSHLCRLALGRKSVEVIPPLADQETLRLERDVLGWAVDGKDIQLVCGTCNRALRVREVKREG